MNPTEWTRDGLTVTTDRARMDLDVIHGYLTQSYWAKGIPRATLERALANALPFAVLEREATVGFARVISDRATYAYLADVFVLEAHRGRGLSKFLLSCIDAHPELQGLRRWQLVTRDAQALYQKVGYAAPRAPERHMERLMADPYGAGSSPPTGP